jgi:hypothetical protein
VELRADGIDFIQQGRCETHHGRPTVHALCDGQIVRVS